MAVATPSCPELFGNTQLHVDVADGLYAAYGCVFLEVQLVLVEAWGYPYVGAKMLKDSTRPAAHPRDGEVHQRQSLQCLRVWAVREGW